MEERLEEHPGCKYILLALITFVMLRQKVRREPHTEEEEVEEEVDEEKEGKDLREWVETLKQVDPMRTGRYNDLGTYRCCAMTTRESHVLTKVQRGRF